MVSWAFIIPEGKKIRKSVLLPVADNCSKLPPHSRILCSENRHFVLRKIEILHSENAYSALRKCKFCKHAMNRSPRFLLSKKILHSKMEMLCSENGNSACVQWQNSIAMSHVESSLSALLCPNFQFTFPQCRISGGTV